MATQITQQIAVTQHLIFEIFMQEKLTRLPNCQTPLHMQRTSFTSDDINEPRSHTTPLFLHIQHVRLIKDTYGGKNNPIYLNRVHRRMYPGI